MDTTQERHGPTVSLALAGGVIEGGFYEVGVLCALEDAIDGLDCTRMHTYVGVSVGAVIASMLANGVSPHMLSRAILSQADATLNVEPEILFTPAFREYARRVGRLPGLLGDWVRRRIRHPLDISLLGSLVELGALAPVGVFDSSPLERYLSRVFSTGGRTNDFRKLAAKLRVVAVKLDTAELVAFGDEETEHVAISRAVQASVSLPGFYCPVEIDGEQYIDGVARRTLNATVALDEGTDLLFCVNPIVPVDMRAASVGSRGRRSLVDYGLPGVLSQTFRTMIHSRMGTGFRNYDHVYPDADVVLIEPELTDHRMFFSNIFSFSNRREVIEHAYACTRRYLLMRADELEPRLAKHGLTLRHDVLADPGRRLFTLEERRRTAREPDVVTDIRHTIDRLNQMIERIDPAA